MRYAVNFRPSSHSEDGTIIATFKTQKHAVEALRKLKRFRAKRLGRRVAVACLSAEYGTLKKSRRILNKLNPVSIENIDDYHQEIIIEATVPSGTTVETAQLLLDQKDIQILNGLIKECGKPECVTTKQKTIIRFKSTNTEVLFANWNPFPNEKYGHFWLGSKQVPATKTFKVKGLF
jgi:hypothetical protein